MLSSSADIIDRICLGCRQRKSLSDFSPHPKGLYGRRSRCKACASAAAVEYNRAHPEQTLSHKRSSYHRLKNDPKFIARRKRYQETRKTDEYRAKINAYRAANLAQRRIGEKKSQLKIKYGLSAERYEEIFVAQNGKCPVCKLQIILYATHNARAACVDHDHVTGAVRGLLCSSCNAGMGALGDDEARLEAALEYLGARR